MESDTVWPFASGLSRSAPRFQRPPRRRMRPFIGRETLGLSQFSLLCVTPCERCVQVFARVPVFWFQGLGRARGGRAAGRVGIPSLTFWGAS